MIKEAAQHLKSAKKVVVLTGAGISKESGIDTFRDKDDTGLWSKYNPMDLASPIAFNKDPKLVWDWYHWRRKKARAAKPNPAHEVVAKWESRFDEMFLVTQNVDGLHQRAGSKNLVCLHGNIWETRCSNTDKVLEKYETFDEVPPYCKCGAMLRPNIVWFGESLAPGVMELSYEKVLNSDVLVVIGTSLVVYPAAGIVPHALQAGVKVIEVNPDQSDFSSQTLFLKGRAGEVMPELDKLLSN
jgi:NAD-dependent deacetylase